MLTSKNFLWLGSFTTLLFLTFCVTFNLDKLNPNIVNISSEELDQRAQEIDENKTFVAKNIDKEKSPQFTIIKIRKETEKYIDITDKFNTASFVEKQNKKIDNSKVEEQFTKIIENKNFLFNKKLTIKQKRILNRLAYKTKIGKKNALFIKTSDFETTNIIEKYLQQIGLESSQIKIESPSSKNNKVNLSLRKRS